MKDWICAESCSVEGCYCQLSLITISCALIFLCLSPRFGILSEAKCAPIWLLAHEGRCLREVCGECVICLTGKSYGLTSFSKPLASSFLSLSCSSFFVRPLLNSCSFGAVYSCSIDWERFYLFWGLFWTFWLPSSFFHAELCVVISNKITHFALERVS